MGCFYKKCRILFADYLIELLTYLYILISDYIGERRSGIHTAVSQDVDKVFKGKTLSQLEMLEQSIKKKLKGGEGVDVGKLLWSIKVTT